jgi:uncharacterized protein YndB with AHSA1/START domain
MGTEPGGPSPGRTRGAQYELPIAVPRDQVWRALTDAHELEQWFPLTATVIAGLGGRYSLRWGDRHAIDDWPIVAWEPPRHLAVGMPKPPGAPPPAHIVTDFVLESVGAQTVLRVVASGFDADAVWDDFFSGIRRGWRFELGSLKHYLEEHAHEIRYVAWAWLSSALSPDAAWRALLAPGGWQPRTPLEQLRPGDRYALAAPGGSSLTGTVMVVDRPTDFSGTVDEFNDGLLRVHLEPRRSGVDVAVWLATYGMDPGRIATLEGVWQSALDRIIPAQPRARPGSNTSMTAR